MDKPEVNKTRISLFDSINLFSNHIKQLNGIVQNPMIVSKEELDEFNIRCINIIDCLTEWNKLVNNFINSPEALEELKQCELYYHDNDITDDIQLFKNKRLFLDEE